MPVILGAVVPMWKFTAASLALTFGGLAHTVGTGLYTIDEKEKIKIEARKRHKRMEKMQNEIAEAQRLERMYLDQANEADKEQLKETQRLAAVKTKEIESKSKALQELIKAKETYEFRDKEMIAKGKSQNDNHILLIAIGCLLLLLVFT
ncbi:MAG: hypothetical protein CMB64_03475 [Euryarchaeota archaeon]|nr:hypothetical protein [Euryarchaeota archaeon]